MFAFDRVENIVGKGENAAYQHFLLFPQCFQKPRGSGSCNSLPNIKILDYSKVKACADDKINGTEKIIEVRYGLSRKHCGKRRKCWLPSLNHGHNPSDSH